MNTKVALIASALGITGVVGCDDPTSRSTSGTAPTPTKPTASTPPATPAPTTKPAAPDNSGVNKRDASGDTKTPMDQSNSKADIDITATIRRAIMDEKGMSTNAQNCKIITDKGVVTLRGVVDSQAEKDSIEAKARAVPGIVRIDNQLEVKLPK